MDSRFTGRFWGYLGRYLLTAFVGAITCGIALPWMFCWLLKWQKSNTYVDGYRLAFDGKGHQLLGRSLLWILLTVVTLGLYAFYLPIAAAKWVTKHTHFAR